MVNLLEGGMREDRCGSWEKGFGSKDVEEGGCGGGICGGGGVCCCGCCVVVMEVL